MGTLVPIFYICNCYMISTHYGVGVVYIHSKVNRFPRGKSNGNFIYRIFGDLFECRKVLSEGIYLLVAPTNNWSFTALTVIIECKVFEGPKGTSLTTFFWLPL